MFPMDENFCTYCVYKHNKIYPLKYFKDMDFELKMPTHYTKNKLL